MTATRTPPPATAGDPIDALIPPPHPWWARLAIAVAIVGGIGVLGWTWHFGVLRPAPDCCGSGSSGAQIGLGPEPGTVTISAYFFNSSGQAITITDATADLPGATVVDVSPYSTMNSYEIPPKNLADLPLVVEAHGSRWLAVTFTPDACADGGGDWGTVTLELEVAGDHWYPTLGRTFDLPDAVVPSGPGRLGILAPATLDVVEYQNIDRPLEAACLLLGR